MIKPENLIPVSQVLTERKIQLCKIIKDYINQKGVQKSDEEIAIAVSKIKGAFFLTESERISNKISSETNPLPDLIKQHPLLLEIVQKELFN